MKIFKIMIALFSLSFLFLGICALAQTDTNNTISGYIINGGNVPVQTAQMGFHLYYPFQESHQSARDYLNNNAYTTDTSPKVIFLTTKPYDQSDPYNAGCAFIITSDSYSYYISAANLGTYSSCEAKVPDGPGFSKQSFLIVNVQS